ncbi:MAG: DinB family protein [Actinomycetota bacterium]
MSDRADLAHNPGRQLVNKVDVMILIDYMYWVNARLLKMASELSTDDFVAPSSVTTRDLRGTLVHELDVEWSWRLNLQGKTGPADEELDPGSFPDAASLVTRWREDEAEMRAWLDTISDERITERVRSRQTQDERPLWHYLVHIVTHAAQQQADVATLLSLAGSSPGEFGFLDYLWSLEG